MRMPSPLVVTVAIVGSVLGYLQVGSYRAAHPLAEEAGAPSFALPRLAPPHDQARLADYRGQVLIVEACSRTCVTCRTAMPALDSLAREYRGRGLQVLHVALEQLADTVQVREFLAPLGVDDRTVAIDQDGGFREQYAVVGIPTSYVIDKHRRLRWQGASTTYGDDHVLAAASGRRLLDELVAEP